MTDGERVDLDALEADWKFHRKVAVPSEDNFTGCAAVSEEDIEKVLSAIAELRGHREREAAEKKQAELREEAHGIMLRYTDKLKDQLQAARELVKTIQPLIHLYFETVYGGDFEDKLDKALYALRDSYARCRELGLGS